jgi:hypothetical protein
MIAEEMSLLSNKQVLKIAFALAKKSPLTLKDIGKSELGKPSRVKMYLNFLVDQGRVVKMRRSLPKPHPKSPPRTVNHYFWADEHTAIVIEEVVKLIERRHRAIAEEFALLAQGFDTP